MPALPCEHFAGKATTLAGLWKSIPKQGSLWPNQCSSKCEANSKLLFGLPFQGERVLSEEEASLKIDPDISELQVKLGDFMPSLELSLDGSRKPYVSLLQAPGSAVWRCTSRSTSTICGETQLPGQPGRFRWKLNLEAGGERCKLEVDHVQTQEVATYYFERSLSFSPQRRASELDNLSMSSDVIADFRRFMSQELRTTVERKASDVPKVMSKCRCLPFF